MAQKDKKRNYRSNGNREYKSDVISMMLQIPEYALDVYNAMNDSVYTDSDMIQIMRLENGISLSVRNDASFFIGNYLNLYEHQSTYSPNAPLRFLIYLTSLLKKMIGKRDLYGRKRVQITTPHFAVFYNGTEKRPEKEVLKLSDAFINQTDTPEIELTVTVYNINPNNNTRLLAKSKVLSGYMIFVNRVRENLEKQKTFVQNETEHDDTEYMEDLETAINEAIDYCIEHHIMETFFMKNRSEVTKSMVLDYTWERREELIRAEEYEDGKHEGLEVGRAEGEENAHRYLINRWLQKGKTIAEIADDLGKSEEYVENLMKS
ncbi:hypothetical protein KQI22_08275 [Kineothrix sp. MSJ-39]|uniref:hypothetical protein n=1 Tax=Kineothrix sp. MSJ-39 TaxID=2841533 RepID=UPI001C0FA069|nr:hypothetical protein [Kineothrix sp. MSJ-39]MBU5430054.1 hypothetical protein [Kineothrix sp. MSJ-39]